MDKEILLKQIKKLIQDYRDADNPYDAEDALRLAFSLATENNIDYQIISSREYHSMLHYSVLDKVYAGSSKQIIEIKLPNGSLPEEFNLGDEIKIRHLITKYDEETNYGNWYLNKDYITLVVSKSMDNLFLITDILSKRNKQEPITNLPRINLPEPKEFIRYLAEMTSFPGMGLRIIK
jgi:hypothetical protein